MIRKLFKEGNKSLSILVLIFVIVMAAGGILLEDDFLIAMKWWVVLLAFGIICMPLSCIIFCKFSDLGWAVSKVMMIAFASWLMWVLDL